MPLVTVITGASAGIGRELALQFSELGTRLVLASRDAARLAEVAEAARERGAVDTIVVPTDVSQLDQCQALIATAVSAFDRIDILVNNAGVSQWARLDQLTDVSVIERLMRVNYLGAAWCTHAALPHLAASRGRIVAVSSLAGLTGVPTHSAYAASKHAMRGFFDSVRVEMADRGVSVTVAYPGFVTTDIRMNSLGPDGQPLGHSPVREGQVMTVEQCARRIVRATMKRQRDVVMTKRGRMGMWLKLMAPGIVDRIAAETIRRGR
jgi:short-subunit dehydrogenase